MSNNFSDIVDNMQESLRNNTTTSNNNSISIINYFKYGSYIIILIICGVLIYYGYKKYKHIFSNITTIEPNNTETMLFELQKKIHKIEAKNNALIEKLNNSNNTNKQKESNIGTSNQNEQLKKMLNQKINVSKIKKSQNPKNANDLKFSEPIKNE
jgi:hypothetical protein